MSENTSKVYFTDFRCKVDEGPAHKLSRLIDKAGLGEIDMDGKFVAIKMHFGELGNMSYLRPNYAKAIVDYVKARGGKPFLTDCNTMYPGFRKNAIEHLYCAWENGFTPLTVGCPVIIGDGLKGTDDIAVPVVGGEYVKEARIGHAIMDADIFISLAHFKGHELTGFGGAIKNIGMGCGSRAGKQEQHCNGKAQIDPEKCRGCKRCLRECANNGLQFDEATKKMTVTENCVGCGRCLGACNFDAIDFARRGANADLNRRMAEYAKAVVYGRPASMSTSLSMCRQTATATAATTRQCCRISACSHPSIRWQSTRPAPTPAWRRSRCQIPSSLSRWKRTISVITTIILKTSRRMLSTKLALSTRKRSGSAAASMS